MVSSKQKIQTRQKIGSSNLRPKNGDFNFRVKTENTILNKSKS